MARPSPRLSELAAGREVWPRFIRGKKLQPRFLTQRRTMSIVTILIIVILVLLAIYLFRRVF